MSEREDTPKMVERVLTKGKHYMVDENGDEVLVKVGEKVKLTPAQAEAFKDKFALPQSQEAVDAKIEGGDAGNPDLDKSNADKGETGRGPAEPVKPDEKAPTQQAPNAEQAQGQNQANPPAKK